MEFGDIPKDEIVLVLQSENLTKNEIKAYLTLLSHGALAELEVSKKSAGVIEKEGIPTAKIYTVLKNLSEKGFVYRNLDKRIYCPKDPSILFDKKFRRLNAVKDNLKEIYQTGQELGPELSEDSFREELVDSESILKKLRDMVSSAQQKITVLSGDYSWLEHKRYSALVEDISSAARKGVKITLIGEDTDSFTNNNSVKQNVKQLTENGVIFISLPQTLKRNRIKVIICDDKHTIKIMPTTSSVIRLSRDKISYVGEYIQSEELVFFFNMLFDRLKSQKKAQ